MKCHACQKWISARLDGPLPAWINAALEAHLDECPDCRRAENDFAQIHLAGCEPVRAPEHFNQGVWDRIQDHRQAIPVFRFPIWVWPAAVAAAMAVIALLPQSLHRVESGLTNRLAADREAGQIKSDQLQSPTTVDPDIAVAPKRPSVQAPASPVLLAPVQHFSRQTQRMITQKQEPVRIPQNDPLQPFKHGRITSYPPEPQTQPGLQAAGILAQTTGTPAQGEFRILNNKIRLAWGEKTRLEWRLPAPGRVQVCLFTLEGRLIRTLAHDNYPAGNNFVEWDGTLENGSRVAAGIYLLVVRGDFPDQRFKIAVIK